MCSAMQMSLLFVLALQAGSYCVAEPVSFSPNGLGILEPQLVAVRPGSVAHTDTKVSRKCEWSWTTAVQRRGMRMYNTCLSHFLCGVRVARSLGALGLAVCNSAVNVV